MRDDDATALFEAAEGGVALVKGALTFGSVGPLLAVGRDAIASGRAGSIDLAGVDRADSAGLALLIEWLSIARQAGREIRYRNLPAQIRQLARLSEVEELLPTG